MVTAHDVAPAGDPIENLQSDPESLIGSAAETPRIVLTQLLKVTPATPADAVDRSEAVIEPVIVQSLQVIEKEGLSWSLVVPVVANEIVVLSTLPVEEKLGWVTVTVGSENEALRATLPEAGRKPTQLVVANTALAVSVSDVVEFVQVAGSTCWTTTTVQPVSGIVKEIEVGVVITTENDVALVGGPTEMVQSDPASLRTIGDELPNSVIAQPLHATLVTGADAVERSAVVIAPVMVQLSQVTKKLAVNWSRLEPVVVSEIVVLSGWPVETMSAWVGAVIPAAKAAVARTRRVYRVMVSPSLRVT